MVEERNMNYWAHYDRMINRARGRVLVGYRERHHVIPRCIGGGDSYENLVDLSPEEHYVAHQLLVKMYPKNARLIYSAAMMSVRCSGNKAYGWLRRRLSEVLRGRRPSGFFTEEVKAKIAKAMTGRPVSKETREKLRAKLKGRVVSAEERARSSEAHTGKSLPLEVRAKIGAALRGKKKPPRSIEHSRKISNFNRGRVRTQEFKDNVAAYRKGKKHSALTKAKISAATLGKKKPSPKYAEAMRARYARLRACQAPGG